MSHSNSPSSYQPDSRLLYRTIWRWHFYAGLFCVPFVLVLALSGGIYLFKPQIDQWVSQPYNNLITTGPRATANQQISAALAAVPGSHFVDFKLVENDQQAMVITVNDQQQRRLVYVHPTSLKILDVIDYDGQFVRLVHDFHGELLVGNVGAFLVELAGCWAMVLIISGLYLGWPRSVTGPGGILYPRFNQGKRIFWRDLHAVTGIWVSALVLFLLVSALPWTLVWGSAFKELRQLDKPQHAQHQQQSWSLGREEERNALKKTSLAPARLSQAILDSAQSLNFAPPVVLAVSNENPALWTVSSQHQNRMLRATARIEQSTGSIVDIQTFSDRPLIDRIVGIGVAAHEGQLFGWFNQLLGVFAASGLMLICVSGLVLWRQRKPASRLGAPPAMPGSRPARVITATLLVLAVLLPVLALSILMLVVLEWLIVRRIPGVRVWLGITAH